jgi:hypothetical protein
MISTCAKCGSHLFEIVEQSPANASYKLWFVQCSGCGNPISSKEYFNSNVQIDELKKKIIKIDSDLGYISQSLGNIEILLRQMNRN